MYPTLVTFHILFAGIWLAFFIFELILRKQIQKNLDVDKITTYLKLTNVFGIIGSLGILATGVFIVIMNSQYGFFDMTSNHWLATKQIIFLIILILTFSMVIPNTKEVKERIKNDKLENDNKELGRLFIANQIINYLVIINFIFAVTHRFYGS